MTSPTNPQVSAGEKARRESQYSFLSRGTVSGAPSGQSVGNPKVIMQEAAVAADNVQPVLQSVHGDFYVPPAGLPVISAPFTRNEYGVIAAELPDVATPSIDPGERILSHPLSKANVRYNSDGSIDIVGDAKVRINNGSQGAITDVTVDTTTDADGHVTSVSLDITRNNDILI